MVIKVQNGVFSSAASESRSTQKDDKEEKKVKNGSIFAGELNEQWSSVALKKEQAQKQAMKIWSDAASAEQKLDTDLEERAAHMEKLRGLMKELNTQIGEISDKQAELAEEYGIAEDTQLAQDVELLMKERKTGGVLPGSFTEEEQARLQELEGSRAQEYVDRYMELESGKSFYKQQLDEHQKSYLEESNAIETIKNSRLKSHAMVDAQKQKDEMMIAASKEAAYGMMNEVKEKIDEKQEEREEKAEEKAEKEEAEEELREAIREKAEGSSKSDDESVWEEMKAEDIIRLDSSNEDVQKEVQKMMDEMNLLVEDLKGAAVDKTL